MNLRLFHRWVALTAVLVASVGTAGERLSVFVSITPQAYFVERVGGDRVEVGVLVPPAQSPATYTVSAAQMAALSETRVYFRIGVPFENTLLPKLQGSLPNLRVVDTSQGVKRRPMLEPHSCEEHDHHHHGCSHAADAMDPHIWLDPLRVIPQATTIAKTLTELDPDGAQLYAANLAAFSKELKDLHTELSRELKSSRGKTFMVFHPAFGYFADSFGLKQEAIEIEGKAPGARQVAMLIERAQTEGVKVIFVQEQFDRRTARNIARTIGGTVVSIDPLAKDYMANLRRIAAAVKKGIDGQQ